MGDERSSVSIDFQPLVLWMDDINALIACLRKHEQPILIKVGKTEFDSFGLFAEKVKGRTVNQLQISIDEPSIELTLSEYENRLYARGDLRALGTALKISNLLRSKARTPLLLYEANAPTILMCASLPLSSSGNTRLLGLSFVYGLVAFVWWGYIFWARTKRRAIIHVFHNFERKNILKENLPAILIAIVGAIAGAIFSRLFSK